MRQHQVFPTYQSLEEERKKCRKVFEELLAKNFPNVLKDMNQHIQEA